MLCSLRRDRTETSPRCRSLSLAKKAAALRKISFSSRSTPILPPQPAQLVALLARQAPPPDPESTSACSTHRRNDSGEITKLLRDRRHTTARSPGYNRTASARNSAGNTRPFGIATLLSRRHRAQSQSVNATGASAARSHEPRRGTPDLRRSPPGSTARSGGHRSPRTSSCHRAASSSGRR